jgi:hypothetical protein
MDSDPEQETLLIKNHLKSSKNKQFDNSCMTLKT